MKNVMLTFALLTIFTLNIYSSDESGLKDMIHTL